MDAGGRQPAPMGGISIGSINGSTFRDINNNSQPAPESPGASVSPPPDRVDVGALTVLADETGAMIEMMRRHRGYTPHNLAGNVRVHEALLDGMRGPVRVALLQTVDRGQQSAANAYHYLRRHYSPTVVVLVGVGGSISELDIGDVAVADTVIDYDNRLVHAGGIELRTQIRSTSPGIRRALNHFFTDHGGETITLEQAWSDHPASFSVMRGPIGSGGAVITDADAEITRRLKAVHQKTLAVETEAIGLTEAFYEEFAAGSDLVGWLVIRGISDRADRHKVQDHHRTASSRAAYVFERIVPYL